MWLLILFGVLLVFGPTRHAIVRNWKHCVAMMVGAAAGWTLGKFVVGSNETTNRRILK